MVVDEKTHKRTFENIKESDLPLDSFPKDYKKERLHILGKKPSGEFWSILAPVIVEANQTPTDVYIALHCAEEVREFYGLSSSILHKIKIGIFAALILGCLIVIFLIVASSSGGAIA